MPWEEPWRQLAPDLKPELGPPRVRYTQLTRAIRDWLYRPARMDWLVRGARHSRRAALLLVALCDAINEHGSLADVVLRAARGRGRDLRRAQAVCDCPDGDGACAPTPRSNEARPARVETT